MLGRGVTNFCSSTRSHLAKLRVWAVEMYLLRRKGEKFCVTHRTGGGGPKLANAGLCVTHMGAGAFENRLNSRDSINGKPPIEPGSDLEISPEDKPKPPSKSEIPVFTRSGISTSQDRSGVPMFGFLIVTPYATEKFSYSKAIQDRPNLFCLAPRDYATESLVQ